MKKSYIIIAGCMALLASGSATSAPFLQFERTSAHQRTVFSRNGSAADFTTLHPETVRKPTVWHAPALLADDEVVTLLDNFPQATGDVNNAATTIPESQKVQWKFYSRGDISYNYIPCAQCIQQYSRPVVSRDSWIYFPIEITEPKAQLNLSYSVSSNISPKKSFKGVFEVWITSATDPSSAVTRLHRVDDFTSTDGDQRYFTDFEGIQAKGPAAAGSYFLAIHVDDCKPNTEGAELGEYDYATYNFGKIILTQTPAAGPVIGPNGEILTMHPTKEEFDAATIIDGNNDGAGIEYYYAVSGDRIFDWPIYYNNQNAKGDADEWFITPAVNFPDSEKLYSVSIDAYATGSFTTEAFDIRIGRKPTVEAMTSVILDEPAVTNNDWQTFASRFGINEAGEYYVGVHMKSPKSGGWRLVMKDLKIALTELSSALPEACSAISAKANPTGELTAEVTVTLPTGCLNGQKLPADSKIDVTISSAKESKTVSGKPGETVTVTIATEEGSNIITAVSSTANGQGGQIKTAVICGLDTPSNPVVRWRVDETNMMLHLEWDAPTTGTHGGVVNPEEMTYNLYIFRQTEQAAGWVRVANDIMTTFVDLQAPSASQELYDFMVSAVNSKGESLGGPESCCSIILGLPYELPMNDTFADGMILRGINIEFPTDEYSGQWALDNPGKLADDTGCADNYALIFVPEYEGGDRGMFSSPKFSTSGCKHVRTAANVYCYSGMAPANLFITDRNGQRTLLGAINAESGSGWTRVSYDLPEAFLDQSALSLTFDVHAPTTASFFMLDDYEVRELQSHDLEIKSLKVPSYVTVGNEVEVTALVANRGFSVINGANLSGVVRYGNNTIAEFKFTPAADAAAMQPDAEIEFRGTFVLNTVDYAGLKLTVDVNATTAETDDDTSNNRLVATFNVGLPAGPVITDLTATAAADGSSISLAWSDPYADGYLENFESYPSACYSTLLGPWKNLDFDRSYTYTLGEIYPVENAGLPKAFQVVNIVDAQLKGALDIPSGDQFLCVMSAEGESDDWLISPEVKPGSMLSFYVTPVSDSFREPLEILYSTTDSDPDSFKSLSVAEFTTPGWDYIELKLPEDARYFALRYFGNDCFGLFIDDIRYTPANPEIAIEGYRVYRNGDVIARLNTPTTFTDKNVTLGTSYRYNVAAVARCGNATVEYPLSNTASLVATAIDTITSASNVTVAGKSGGIVIEGGEGLQAEIFNTTGAKVAETSIISARHSFSVQPGIYIVKVGTAVTKVNVR